MKNKNQKKIKLLIFSSILIITIGMAINTSGTKDDTGGCGCHPGGYIITSDLATIEGEGSSIITLDITATGANLVVDVYAGALDNDLFTISPGNIVADGDANDLDAAADAINVKLDITLPSERGEYTLRILARDVTLSGINTPLATLDLVVTVGEPIPPTILELFFNHYNLYLGGTILILASIGTVMFHIYLKKESDSKFPGTFLAASFALLSINVLLILNDSMEYLFVLLDGTNMNIMFQIIIGTIGYGAGIFVVFGIYTDVPMHKLKVSVNLMMAAIAFNFFYGNLTLTPLGG